MSTALSNRTPMNQSIYGDLITPMSKTKFNEPDTRSFNPDRHLPVKAEKQEEKVKRDFWDKLKRVLSRIPFAEDLIAAYYCAMDSQTPTKVRVVLLGALAYFIMPLDIIPDFILGVGYTDDAAILAAAISTVAAHITPKHRDAAKQALNDEDFGAGPNYTA